MSSASRGYGFDAARLSPPQAAPGGGGKTLFEGYRKDILSEFKTEQPRYNPLNPERPQSSALVDLKDPIQVHLLTETALSDSKEYEILSQEEVDDLKKQSASLAQRIEQTRANLAIQAKYRDAAISMSKLYSSPARPAGKRRSLLGNRSGSGGGEESAREAELERQASEKRCEDLASELFSLEKRLMEPQRRLLQHTAGILQMTHRAPKRPGQPMQGQQPGAPAAPGIPGSPESLYTYTNGRNSIEPSLDDPYFDDRSLYMPLDQIDGPFAAPARKNPIEIPMKSPIREQANQLREEGDRLREENARLAEEARQMRATGDALGLEADALRRQNADHLKVVSYTERKLKDLNDQLREVVVKFNPDKNANYKRPPTGSLGSTDRSLEPGDLIASQLDYLKSGLAAAQQEQEQAGSAGASAADTTELEGRIEDLNKQLRDALVLAKPAHPLPPGGLGMKKSDLNSQLDYLEMSLREVETQLQRSADLASSSANKPDGEKMEKALVALWDMIQRGYAGIQQRKAERRRERKEQGLEPDEEDLSEDESLNTNESYSLAAFTAKVQSLYTQATSLKEQKSVLKRQVKQQRELNSKSDSDKKSDMKRKADELQQTKTQVAKVEKEARDAQEKLAQALKDLEVMQKGGAARDAAASKALQAQLEERNDRIATLEAESKALQASLEKVDTDVAALQAEAEGASEARSRTEQLQADLKAREAELEEANRNVVELKTEVTIARAELDGAYGSRAQRAAEVAALSKDAQSSEMAGRVEKLEAELASTLKEFEDMTRETIAAEKEKLDLEGRLDDALAAKAALEGEARGLREKLDKEVAGLREQLDAERLKAAGGGGGGGAGRSGATMLSEQFRATMKEERKKFQEELREEQGKRRKLEEELRTMKKAQGPGRSPLGPLSPR